MNSLIKGRGFTLIELLVVIAIIGLLASIVLVSLGNARQKGADAGIQGNLDSIRTQAEVYASNNNNSYGAEQTTSNCTTGLFSDPTIKAAVEAAASASGAAATCVSSDGITGTSGTSANQWAVSVPLKSNNTLKWCVDSTGLATSTSGGANYNGTTFVTKCI